MTILKQATYLLNNGRPLWYTKGLGLLNINFNKGAQQFQNENWIVIKMKLNKEQWLPKRKC